MATRAPVRLPRWLEQLLDLAHVDWEPPSRQPSARQLFAASALAVVGSLLADTLLVALGTHVFPSTRGFPHFRIADYASLTVVGVLFACAGWPIVSRITSTPRWLFYRLAVAVTLVLLLPDLWILLRGEPVEAVGVLVTMHLAIALVTYHCLVYVAPTGRRRRAYPAAPPEHRREAPLARAIVSGRAHAPAGVAPATAPAGVAPAAVAGGRRAIRDTGDTGPRVTATAEPQVQDVEAATEARSRPARVARPPVSLAEPRSAVRVLPPRGRPGLDHEGTADHRDDPRHDRTAVTRRTAGGDPARKLVGDSARGNHRGRPPGRLPA